MEPTLHCAEPGVGCQVAVGDRVRVREPVVAPARSEVLAFRTPQTATVACGARGVFITRLIGLPGDKVYEDKQGFIWVDGKRLDEPYVEPLRRREDVRDNDYRGRTWTVPEGEYFFIGDNRGESCDSRRFGTVPAGNLIGTVVEILRPG